MGVGLETPEEGRCVQNDDQSRIVYTRVCQALRGVLKDDYYYSTNGGAAEAEAMAKLGDVRLHVEIDGKDYEVKVAVRSYEGATADGFALAWPSDLIDAPHTEASPYEWWEWARKQTEVTSIAFDIKTLNLNNATVSEAHYYQWGLCSARKPPKEGVQLIIVLVEGIDDYVAVIPHSSWRCAQEKSFGIETIAHGMPLWVPLFMVADIDLEAAFSSVIGCALAGEDFCNPTNGAVLSGLKIQTTLNPNLDPTTGEDISFTTIVELWKETEAMGGHVVFNPMAPHLIDFALSLPGAGLLWIEHKAREQPMDDSWRTNFRTDARRNPFHQKRVWHMLYVQCPNGVLCIMRDEIPPDGSWSGRKVLPADFVHDHFFPDLKHALPHICEHAAASRNAVIDVLRKMEPECINDALPTDQYAQLQAEDLRTGAHDPLVGLMKRIRSIPGLQSDLNRWSRSVGKANVLALGSGCGLGHLLAVEHEWTEADKENFDVNGRLPFYLHTRGIGQRKCVPLICKDHSQSYSLGKPQWWPFGLRREHWRKPLEHPRHLIIGSLVDAHDPGEWVLVLPSGHTKLYDAGQFLTETSREERATGAHFCRPAKLEDLLVSKPAPPTHTKPFTHGFLVDKNINLGRYVLSLYDGTVHREILKVLESEGDIYIANPVLRDEPSKLFAAEDYRTTLREAIQLLWTLGYFKQSQPASSVKHKDIIDAVEGT